MVNEKDQKVIRAWDSAMSLVLQELFLKPDEIAVMEEASKLHILTEQDVTKMGEMHEAIEQKEPTKCHITST